MARLERQHLVEQRQLLVEPRGRDLRTSAMSASASRGRSAAIRRARLSAASSPARSRSAFQAQPFAGSSATVRSKAVARLRELARVAQRHGQQAREPAVDGVERARAPQRGGRVREAGVAQQRLAQPVQRDRPARRERARFLEERDLARRVPLPAAHAGAVDPERRDQREAGRRLLERARGLGEASELGELIRDRGDRLPEVGVRRARGLERLQHLGRFEDPVRAALEREEAVGRPLLHELAGDEAQRLALLLEARGGVDQASTAAR
jgi:hypothetical protein